MASGFDDAIAVLEEYAQWEADLISRDEAWKTSDGLPYIPQDLWNRFIELQMKRNRVLENVFLRDV